MLKVGDSVVIRGPRHYGAVGVIRKELFADHEDFLVELSATGKMVPVASYEIEHLADCPSAAPSKPEDWRMYFDDSSARRKDQPVFSGFVRYFPAAMALVAELSRLGNEKHNKGEPMHHARGKSTDHGDCVVRHQATFEAVDHEVQLAHAVAVAWRAMAQLQVLAETKYGWPLAPGAKE